MEEVYILISLMSPKQRFCFLIVDRKFARFALSSAYFFQILTKNLENSTENRRKHSRFSKIGKNHRSLKILKCCYQQKTLHALSSLHRAIPFFSNLRIPGNPGKTRILGTQNPDFCAKAVSGFFAEIIITGIIV